MEVNFKLPLYFLSLLVSSALFLQPRSGGKQVVRRRLASNREAVNGEIASQGWLYSAVSESVETVNNVQLVVCLLSVYFDFCSGNCEHPSKNHSIQDCFRKRFVVAFVSPIFLVPSIATHHLHSLSPLILFRSVFLCSLRDSSSSNRTTTFLWTAELVEVRQIAFLHIHTKQWHTLSTH